MNFTVDYSGADGMSASQTDMPHCVRSMENMGQNGNPIHLKARRGEEEEVGEALNPCISKIQASSERWLLSVSQGNGVGRKRNRAGERGERSGIWNRDVAANSVFLEVLAKMAVEYTLVSIRQCSYSNCPC